MRARGIESGGDSSDDDRPRYYFFYPGAGGGRNNVYIISLVWRIKVYLGLEDQREWRINTNLLTRFGGSRLGEDQGLSRFGLWRIRE